MMARRRFVVTSLAGPFAARLGAFSIDCHDREVPAFVASPRSLTGADIRTLYMASPSGSSSVSSNLPP